jgi:alpha-beta hydrolase superfamily lysophospholipase
MDKSVYYLTGMGGRLDVGLGQGLLRRGFDVAGRALFGEFKKLKFQQQVDLVVRDLQNSFWREDAHVIANSFGAYIFLHAQAQMDPYIGKVILLSPIVGEFSSVDTRIGFIPPRADKLIKLAEAGSFPTPKNCEAHVGSEDWQSNPVNVTAFGSIVGIDVKVVPGAGHMLPQEYVGLLLDRWLN